MNFNELGINMNEVIEAKDEGDFSAMPTHTNKFVVTDAEGAEFKSRAKGAKITIQIVGDEYKGRIIFLNIVLVKSDGTPNKAGMGEYIRLCGAAGITDPLQTADPAYLQGKLFSANVTKKPASGDFPESNGIASPKPIDGTVAQSPAAFQQPVQNVQPVQQPNNPFGG